MGLRSEMNQVDKIESYEDDQIELEDYLSEYDHDEDCIIDDHFDDDYEVNDGWTWRGGYDNVII